MTSIKTKVWRCHADQTACPRGLSMYLSPSPSPSLSLHCATSPYFERACPKFQVRPGEPSLCFYSWGRANLQVSSSSSSHLKHTGALTYTPEINQRCSSSNDMRYTDISYNKVMFPSCPPSKIKGTEGERPNGFSGLSLNGRKSFLPGIVLH